MRKPSGEQIKEFIGQQSLQPFSYPDLEATRGPAPSGYAVDQSRESNWAAVSLSTSACKALLRWRMFELPWVQLCWPTVAMQPGNTVAILAHVTGGARLNACRIVYTFDQEGASRRGALPTAPCPNTPSAAKNASPWSGAMLTTRCGTKRWAIRSRTIAWRAGRPAGAAHPATLCRGLETGDDARRRRPLNAPDE